MTRYPGGNVIVLGLELAASTLVTAFARTDTALVNNIPRSLAAGLVVVACCGTVSHTVAIIIDRSPITVLFRITMARIHFKQSLPLRVVLLPVELLVKGGSCRCIQAPGITVGNHDTVIAPLIKFAE